jgi:acyl transferase domain-containing protein/NADP-dependent 3-hydroxy acid dehydrogenase YdfG
LNPDDPAPSTTPVAIIGMGCLFPRADGLARYWANIRAGVDAIADVPETHWSVDDYFDGDPKAPDRTYARRGGFLDPVDFPPLDFGITPTAIEATDTTQLLGLLVARRALEDAGYGDGRTFDRERVSVILGVTGTLELVIPLGARLGHPIWRRALRDAGVDPTTAEDVVRRIAASYVGWQENSFPGLLGNVAAGRIANRLDLRGTNCVVDAACASSLGAVNLALLELDAGRSDIVVTGGLDTFNDVFMYMCFSKTPALSPTGDARPFDADADGTILGEGLGILVLKRLADARRDGDRVYAVIRGMGTSSDGRGQAVYAPSAAGQVRALRRAYAMAGIDPATVGLVEAHGTGTKVGDATELEALEEVFRGSLPGGGWCALGSVKSQVGHTKAAAGAAGLIKAAMALHHKVLPPTLKVRRPAESLASGDSPFYVNSEARPWLTGPAVPRRAAVSAFGFGGSNFHCVLEEAESEPHAVDWDGDVQVLAFSADDRSTIAGELESLANGPGWAEVRAAGARSRASFRHRHRHRLLIVARRADADWSELMAEARSHLEAGRDPRANGRTRARFGAATDSRCVFAGHGQRPGPLALLFPGQGSQYVGMFRDLACVFPRMQAALSAMNRTAGPDAGSVPASDRIYPPAAFDERVRQARDDALRDTRIAQPAIGAVSLGLLGILEDFGVRAELVGGHSFGELTALRAAGRIDDAAFATLARLRGSLMADCAARGRGAMLAAFATIEEVEAALPPLSPDVVIANKNAPRQCVLSGGAEDVERAARALSDRGIMTRSVPVSAAFHSRFVAAAQEPFRRALEAVPLAASTIPVFANATAAPYPDDLERTRELLAGQLARPVEFVAQIQAMYERGARTFVEVGPDHRLTELVRSILEGRPHHAIAVDASRGSAGNLHDLACSLATLSALGYAVDLTRWDDGYAARGEPARKTGLTVRLSGANPRPRGLAAGDRSPEDRSIRIDRQANRSGRGITRPSRLAMGEVREMTTPQRLEPEVIAENDRLMNPHERTDRPPHKNGEVTAMPVPGADLVPEHEGRSSTRQEEPVEPAPGVWPSAFLATQENLVALQRLAEQTADLHRQFLEGQDRIQQAFLKLLEHQQRLVRDPRAPAGSSPDPGMMRETLPVAGPLEQVPENGPVGWVKPTENRQKGSDKNPGLATVGFTHPTTGPNHQTADPAAAALIAVVAEKTGYPAESLELDMRLEDDLGIDSIKRVEILSAMQERFPGMPSPSPDRLAGLRTLRAIAESLAGTTGPLARRPEAASSGDAAAAGELARVLIEAVAEKTGYPAEVLELDMRLEDDLGIDSIKRVEILSAMQERLPGLRPVGPEHTGALRTLREIAESLTETTGSTPTIVRPIENGRPATDGATPITRLGDQPGIELRRLEPRALPMAAAEPRDAVSLSPGATIWITNDGSSLTEALRSELGARGFAPRVIAAGHPPTLAPGEDLSGLIVLAPEGRVPPGFVSAAFRTIRGAGPALERAGGRGGAALVTISRLDGRFGVEGLRPGIDPASGALAGLCKTAAWEWPGVHCKALDLGDGIPTAEQAVVWIVEELLARGPSEVGLDAEGRVRLALRSVTRTAMAPGRGRLLGPDDLVVISGGARGITAEVAVALAQAFGPRILVLGRSPAPEEEEPPEIAACRDEAALKRRLLSGSGQGRSPQAVAERVRRILAVREIRCNLGRIAAAGSRVSYRSVDVRDRAGVREAIESARAEHGPVRGLLHGAGVLADRRIVDQTDAQFELVYDTKVRGLHHLFDAVDPDGLAFLVLFSSSTARLGRNGQVAYAAANEYLNKWAQQAAVRLSDCRIVSFNWGPWAGGMVGDSLRSVFEKEGLHLIPPEAGAEVVLDEIQRSEAGPGPVEVVVVAGGTDAAPAMPPRAPDPARKPAAERRLETVLRRSVDLGSVPVLADHVIDGHSVLPMALILEWTAEGALHRNPGLSLRGVDDLRLFKGVVLGARQTSVLDIAAAKAVRDGEEFRVPVEVRGRLDNGREIVHARAEVLLSARHAEAQGRSNDLPLPRLSLGPDDIYGPVLFHGPAMQGIHRVEECGERGIAGRVRTAPSPSEWLDRPLRSRWLTDPLAVDCAFQLVVLWTRDRLGASSLPTAVGRYRQFRPEYGPADVRVVVEIRQASEARAVADIDFLDGRGELVARIESYECVVDASLDAAFLRNQLTAPTPVTAS